MNKKALYDNARQRLLPVLADAVDLLRGNNVKSIIDDIDPGYEHNEFSPLITDWEILTLCEDCREKLEDIEDPSSGCVNPRLDFHDVRERFNKAVDWFWCTMNDNYHHDKLPEDWSWVGAIAAPDGYNGHAYVANVAKEKSGKLWVFCERGRFPIPEEFFKMKKISDHRLIGVPVNLSPSKNEDKQKV